jgi:hypothetical protein
MYERKIRYTTVSISENLMNDIKKHITKYKRNISGGDFVREAIKEKMKNDERGEKIWNQYSSTPQSLIALLRQDPTFAKIVFESGEKEFNKDFPNVKFHDVFHKNGTLKGKEVFSVEERLNELEENTHLIIGMLDELLDKKESKKKKDKVIPKAEMEFMKKFYGEKKFNEIMSGNVPFEKFVKDTFGLILDEKTGKLKDIDPSLIKSDNLKKLEEIIVATEGKKENKKKRFF